MYIDKDAQGFIWIGRSQTLSRFDGHRFTGYRVSNLGWSYKYGYTSKMSTDRQGNIFFTCLYGILRYDPQRDVFHDHLDEILDQTTEISPPRGEIHLHDSTVWFFENNVIRKLEPSHDSGYVETLQRLNTNLGRTSYMEEFPDGEIWIGADSGLYHLEDTLDKIILTRYHVVVKNHPEVSQEIRKIIAINEHLWLLTADGIIRTEIPSPTEYGIDQVLNGEYIRFEKPEIGLTPEDVPLTMDCDDANDLYFRTFQGIYGYSIGSGDIERIYKEEYGYHPTIAEFWSIMLYDERGLLWAGTPEGLLKINLGNKHFHVIWVDSSNPKGLTSFDLNQITIDRNNHLWVGDLSEGLHRSIPDTEGQYLEFDHFAPDPNDPYSLHHQVIHYIMEDTRGNLYVSSGGPEGKTQRIHVSDDQIRFETLPIPKRARQILEDPAGRIFITSSHETCWIYNPFSGEAHPFFLDKERTPAQKIYLQFTSDHKTYMGTSVVRNKGEFTFCEITGQIILSDDKEPFYYPEKVKILLDTSDFSSIDRFLVTEHDNHKEFWITDRREGALFRYRWHDPPVDKEMDVDDIQIKPELVNKYTVDNGLSDDRFYDIIEDNHKRIWVPTEEGLNCIDPETNQIYRFYERDGLPGNNCNNGRFTDKTGRIWLAVENGIVYFHPDSVLQEEPLPVYITGLRLFNKPVDIGKDAPLKKSIMLTDRLTLPYNQNFLTLEFAALDFTNTEEVRYLYQMEGLEPDWVKPQGKLTANYPNMRPGRYTFRVIASNSNGVWNREGATLAIRIRPPPWLSWWAYLLYGAGVIWLILWYRRYLLNRSALQTAVEVERIEKEKVLEIDKIKSRFFTNISHEFRTPLTLILGPLEKLDRQKSRNISVSRDLVSSMRRNAKRLLGLINQLLDISKLEMGEMAIQASEGDMEGFVRAIVLSFLSLAESKRIKYTYEFPGTSQNHYFDPDKLEKILANLISNAFKYTSVGGEVSIQMDFISLKDSLKDPSTGSDHGIYAEIKIKDTGKGIPAEKLDLIFDRFYQVSDSDTREEEGTGIGLAHAKDLVDLYRGKIYVESKVGKGSTFTVTLPVSRELFQQEEIVERRMEKVREPDRAMLDPNEDTSPGRRYGRKANLPKTSSVILIVEDNADLRNYLSGNLDESYQILMAENGRSGLDLAIENIPDLIISDVMMPGMDGMEMCKHLKQDERTSHIPVIMLTAKADRDSKLEGLDTGVDDYLVKPFDTEELHVRVKNLIDQRKRLREKIRHEIISEPNMQKITTPDDQLLHKILDLFNSHLSEPEFNTDHMSDDLNMSRMQMYRKINALTGYTPVELLRTLRLKKAVSLFDHGHNNIAQVMFQVGFNNQSYFAKCFRRLYRVNPSEYLKAKNR